MEGRPGPRFGDRGAPPLRYVGRLEPPVWLEGRAALELMRLRRHPVFTGAGVPRGDGRPVLLIAGFMAGDRSLHTLRDWLERLGYRAEVPGLLFNVRCSEAVLRTVLLRAVDLYWRLGRPVTLVGHSRGGLLAKVAADRHPEMIQQVVALGSPLADPYDVHPLTLAGVRAAQVLNLVRYGDTAFVERTFLRELHAQAKVPLTSIYSRTDGIVHWEACVRPDARCLEVDGSHVGLAVNRAVYELLARVLADGPPAAARRGA